VRGGRYQSLPPLFYLGDEMTLLEFFSDFDKYDTAVTRNGEIIFKSSAPFDVDQTLDVAIPDNYEKLIDVESAQVFGDSEQLAILVLMYGISVVMGVIFQHEDNYHTKLISLEREFAKEHG
jgi:hypothetical protein